MESKTSVYDTTLKKSGIKILMPLLGFCGILISSYLTYIHYQSLNPICLFNANCDAVLSSQYSTMWGIPLSLFGLLMYVVLTAQGLISLKAGKGWQDHLALGTYSVALSGTLFTLYLYYLEVFEIHAFCSWCIGSSILIFGILAISLIDLIERGLTKKI